MAFVDWYDEVPKYGGRIAVLPFPNMVVPSFEGRFGWGGRNGGGGGGKSKGDDGENEGIGGKEAGESDGETVDAVFNSRLERRKR